MKALSLLTLILMNSILNAQLFEQDFSSSSTVGDYVNPSPGNTLFNSISTSGAGVTVSILSGRLRYVRTGSNTGSFTRNADMAGPPGSLIFQFDLAVTGSTTPATSVALFYVGNNFSTTNTTEANADVFARFSVNTTPVDGNFQLRDITNGTNSSILNGTVRIWWVINNSGVTKQYKAPDGTNASVATGKADLWGGSTILFNDVSVQTPSQTIADIKFINNQGSQTIDIDNILIDPIPSSPVTNAATSVGPNSFTANWDAVPGANGYRLDVSKHNDFSTFVSGYDGSYISGGGTASASVTGLLWGNTYYYRVRSSADYIVAGFESGHSNVTDVVTGVLPVVFTGIAAKKVNGKTEVSFSIASGSNVSYYELQKSRNGSNFQPTGIITRAVENTREYLLVDPAPSGTLTFYRVAAQSDDGSTQLSNIIAVRTPASETCRLRIISNPVMNGRLSFTSEAVPDGICTVTILSTSGELLVRKELIFRKGVMTTIPLHRFQAGSYILLVKGVVQLSELFVIGQ